GLLLVAKEEGLDHSSVELFAIELAVAIPVVRLDPGLGIRGRPHLRHHRLTGQEQEHGRSGKPAEPGTHHRSPLSALNLPAAYRLTAGRAVGLLALAADGHVALNLATVRAAGLVGSDGRYRALVPGVWVRPRNGLACGSRLERSLLRLGGQPLVALVERVAAEAAQQRAADDRPRDGCPAPARRGSDQPAERGAAEATDRCLRIVLHRGAARRKGHDEQQNCYAPQDWSRHESFLLIARTSGGRRCCHGSDPPGARAREWTRALDECRWG